MTAHSPLILASGSAIRAELLTRAGLKFAIVRPAVDESQLKRQLHDLSPPTLARELAVAKARSVSESTPQAIVIGADQVLSFEGKAHDKPASRAEARQQLRALRGKTHALETTVCCCRAGELLWTDEARASLTMREFSEAFLDHYLDDQGDDVLTSVGGYKLEERGIQLFSDIAGDYFGILGLPLLPLLEFLRSEGVIAT